MPMLVPMEVELMLLMVQMEIMLLQEEMVVGQVRIPIILIVVEM